MTLSQLIGGEFYKGKNTYPLRNPMTGELICEVATATACNIEQAVEAAEFGFHSWNRFTPGQREDYLLQAGQALASVQDELTETIMQESGSTYSKAAFEVAYAKEIFKAAAGEVRRLYGDTFPSDSNNRISMVQKEPLGPIAVISPFNAPLALLVKMLAFPLAAGNSVVIKPSEHTPLTAMALGRFLQGLGLPPGCINIINGLGSEVGAPLINHSKIKGVTFTGSTPTGRKIAQQAGGEFKRLHLELGGNNALIVCEDANLELAARKACFGAFYHSGQICMASSRILIHRQMEEKFLSLFIAQTEKLQLGPLKDPETAYGCLINEAALSKVKQHQQSALAAGGRLLTGGKVFHHLRYLPTIISEASTACLPWQEETFGPLTLVRSFESDEEAIQLANDSRYGLSAGIMTESLTRGHKLAKALRVGSVHLQSHPFHSETMAPVGGLGYSGVGRSGGKYSTEHFVENKWISVEVDTSPLPKGFQ